MHTEARPRLIPATPRMLILNVGQAEAVYRAMCELNNVGGRIGSMSMANGEIIVNQYEAGNVSVRGDFTAFGLADESYESQDDFAASYGLARA